VPGANPEPPPLGYQNVRRRWRHPLRPEPQGSLLSPRLQAAVARGCASVSEGGYFPGILAASDFDRRS